ncbi:MAG TPA: isoprenyl transferase [candidate division Zixibacteria bacterium]|nr:isoprenyl transferase [candidate division Zixibacteria bacterium]
MTTRPPLADRIEALKTSARIPAHIAIIMDGNGRWAAARGLPRREGHEQGVSAVKRVVEAASELGVKTLTLYTFSEENWKRPREEVEALMSLLSRSTLREIDDLMRNNVRLIVTGRLEDLPAVRRVVLQDAIKRTADNTGLTLNLALSYGGRREIVDAVRALCADALSGAIAVEEINERLFSRYLYTADLPDPDLLIRTSGEQRLSNFLLWQTSYTELYITDTLWPDFDGQALLDAIEDYLRRERRYGLTSAQTSE